MRGLTMLFSPKSAEEHDAHIISRPDFIVAVQPADAQTVALLSRAEVAGRRVICLGPTSSRRAQLHITAACGVNCHLNLAVRAHPCRVRIVTGDGPNVPFWAWE